jgi:hypothetical protein
MIRGLVLAVTIIAIYDHIVCRDMLSSAAVQMVSSMMGYF